MEQDEVKIRSQRGQVDKHRLENQLTRKRRAKRQSQELPLSTASVPSHPSLKSKKGERNLSINPQGQKKGLKREHQQNSDIGKQVDDSAVSKKLSLSAKGELGNSH